MMAEILEPTPENIVEAARRLEEGEAVAFPTETVYGIGANARNSAAVEKVFLHKHRSMGNPLGICYRDLAQASGDMVVTAHAAALAEAFLPGPITLLLERRCDASVSPLCSAGTNKIGVRISSNGILQNLLAQISFPLATSSANRSSAISPTTAALALKQLQSVENLIILDGGSCEIGIESTLLDASEEDSLIIVRNGAISPEEIYVTTGILCKNAETRPAHHYTFHKKIVLNATSADPQDALLAFGTPCTCQCLRVLNLSENGDLQEAASHLFAMLQILDNSSAEKICVMPIPFKGIGIAINDRLIKAAGGSE
jgi:L-threonylcarbamoyladenylate synthase